MSLISEASVFWILDAHSVSTLLWIVECLAHSRQDLSSLPEGLKRIKRSDLRHPSGSHSGGPSQLASYIHIHTNTHQIKVGII